MSEFSLIGNPVLPMADGAEIAVFIYGPADGARFEDACSEDDACCEDASCCSGSSAELPIVMLHGNGESHENMQQLIEMVAPERVVIALDSRGHGASKRGRDRLSYERMAEDVQACLAQLNVPRAHIFGFSDGGIVALMLAMSAPELVASETVMGANLSPAGLREDFLEGVRTSLEELGEAEGEASTESAANSVAAAEVEPSGAYSQAELLRLMLDEPHISPYKLAKIACPVAVMIGSDDLVTYEEAYAIAEAIPNSSLTVVKGCGHDLPNEAPERVLQEAASAIEEAEEESK